MNIPKLRFKDNNGNDYPQWEKKKLGDISDVRDGTHDSPKYINSGYPLITSKNIQNGKISFDNINYISKEDYDNINRRSKVSVGDIIMGMIGTIGNVALLSEENFAIKNVALFKEKTLLKNIFLIQYLQSDIFYKSISNLNEGGTQKFISLKNIRNLYINIPFIEEQEKIANFLIIVDKKIENLENTITSLGNQKKGLLQQIFSQKLRFKDKNGNNYPNWEKKKLGDTLLIQRGGSPRPISDYITNDKNGLNWIKIGDCSPNSNIITSTKEKIKPEGLSKTREVFIGDLILSNSMSFGRPYILNINGCIHDGWLLLRNTKKIYNLQFLCYILGSEYTTKQYKKLASGSTVNNLNIELVSSVDITIPCLEEQTKIADFLSAFDRKLENQKAQLEHWQQIKKGLLQQMFV